ncbi:MAG: hypothetical protein QF565_07415 [Arenicellales bacterium]|nr:hypothetical protein [Arenicellales bacterium]
MRKLILVLVSMYLVGCEQHPKELDVLPPESRSGIEQDESRSGRGFDQSDPGVAEDKSALAHNVSEDLSDMEQYLDDLDNPYKWQDQLDGMQSAYEAIAARSLLPSQEALAWEKFLDIYATDVPDTMDDQQMRSDANANMLSARLDHAETLSAEFQLEAMQIIDGVLKHDPRNTDAYVLAFRISHQAHDSQAEEKLISRIESRNDEQLTSDFYLEAARRYQVDDEEISLGFYAKVKDTSKLTSMDDPYYQEASYRTLRKQFEEAVRIARTQYVRGNTQTALGLTDTTPSDSGQWVNRLLSHGQFPTDAYQPGVSADLSDTIYVDGDIESVTLVLPYQAGHDRLEVTITRAVNR